MVAKTNTASQIQTLHSNAFVSQSRYGAILQRVCICEYEGYFTTVGRPLRIDILCPNCGSMERHRLLILAVQRGGIPQLEDKNSTVLHFAAEPCLEQIFRNRFASYTADLFTEADLKLDMECIEVADSNTMLLSPTTYSSMWMTKRPQLNYAHTGQGWYFGLSESLL